MSKKVYELAKELEMSSKSLLEKLNSMGVPVNSHMNVVSDEDCRKIASEVRTKSESGNRGENAANGGNSQPRNEGVRRQESQSEGKEQRQAADDQARVQGDRPRRAEGQAAGQDQRRQAEGQGRTQADGQGRPQGDRPRRPEGQAAGQDQRRPADVQNRPQGDRPRRADGQMTGQGRPQADRPRRAEGQTNGQGQGQRRPADGQNRPQGDRPRRPDGQNNGQGQGQRRPVDGQNRPQGDRLRRPEGQGNGQGRYGDGQGRPQGDRPRRPEGQGSGQGRYGDGQGRPQGDRPRRPEGQGNGQNRTVRRDSAPKGEMFTEKQDRRRFDNKDKSNKNQDSPLEREQGRNNRSRKLADDKLSSNKPYQKKQKDTRKEQRREAARKAEEEAMAIPAGAKQLTVPITVQGFAEQTGVSASQVIMSLMRMGIMANLNQSLDEDTVTILADELHLQIYINKVEEEILEEGIENYKDREEDLKPRPPVITVMGHVDHGKTSLLDKIRNTKITASESGGITQHIGASEVVVNGNKIVFLDTPGHEAFTAMRARGAYITDIAVLVVAADDSVKPQTIEAISHAKAANVPIIVAINKIDKPGANIDRVKQDLAENGVLIEDWGGDVISVPVSAKTGEGIDTLLEMILLQAEMMELKANPDRLARGTVIEAKLDNARGPVASLLVTNGTLQAGMPIVVGRCSGRIRAMSNFKGEPIKKAGPATAVEILGLTDVPQAGDEFNAVRSDKVAREIAEQRQQKLREDIMTKSSNVSLEELFSQIQEGEVKELNLIIKADVMGSVGALVSSLERLKTENVKVKIIHTGVGTVTESDIMLASTSGSVIIGFNIRPSSTITAMAEREGVEIRTYRVIYDIINDVEAAMKGMLDPVFKEVVLGTIEIRDTFKVPNVGTIGGGYVTEGKAERNASIRLVRDGIVIHEGKISSLRRFKDDVKEVQKGYECGIGIENYNDIKVGDVIEAFKMEEVER